MKEKGWRVSHLTFTRAKKYLADIFLSLSKMHVLFSQSCKVNTRVRRVQLKRVVVVYEAQRVYVSVCLFICFSKTTEPISIGFSLSCRFIHASVKIIIIEKRK